MAENKKEFELTHSLGKGEVVSSILPGSTRNALQIGTFQHVHFLHTLVRYRTKRESRKSIRGISVDFVHPTFGEIS